MPAARDELCDSTALELAGRLGAGEISAREVLAAHLDRIDASNGSVNAIVTLIADAAQDAAAAADERFARQGTHALGSLHGLPIAHKDLALTAGVRTTFGSPIFADFVPEEDELFVQRVRDAGAIVVGKTNTPEFGAGSQTFNPVFGVTRNPYDTTKTAGGSSGGAAAALACGMVPIADGSDLGGSLRNPASFCGVVGFRPTPGRVPSLAARDRRDALAVEGPMARTVQDAALLLSAMAGPDPRTPISLDGSGSRFAPPLDDLRERPRVAWAPRADGSMPFERAVVEVFASTRVVFESLGCDLDEGFPDLGDARDVFLTLRAHGFASEFGPLLAEHREQIKPTVIWNIEQGLAQTDADLERAELAWAGLRRHVDAFFERFDFLVLPVCQVVPFDVELEYPTQIEGTPMTTYLDWMESCWSITVTECPAISVPAGFTIQGLPVGVQIVGRPGADLEVLRFAHAFERARGPRVSPPR